MAHLTVFGKEVKKKLIDKDLNQKWLIAEIRMRTGMYVDDSYLAKIFVGKYSAPKIKQTICDILDIPIADIAAAEMREEVG